MKKLDELVNTAFKEAKQQEDKRREYITLIHDLIERTERDFNNHMTCRINFYLYRNTIGKELIIFGENPSVLYNGLSDYDEMELEKSNKKMDECINYLYNLGVNILDDFIDHLSTVAIPSFLQNHKPQPYEVFSPILYYM